MTIARPLPEAFWPEEIWQEPARWEVCSIEEAFAVRTAAGEIVDLENTLDSEPMSAAYASARARVETTIGELVINGLQHGGPQVGASLARGTGGWLIVVSDPAADRPPRLGAFSTVTAFTAPHTIPAGGLGLLMVMGLATMAGWFAEDDSKHVWATIADIPPSHVLP